MSDSDSEGSDVSDLDKLGSDSSDNYNDISSSEESGSEEISGRMWCEINCSLPTISPPRYPFTGKPGVNVNVNVDDNFLRYFLLFFDNDLAELIATEMNRFASQYIQTHPQTKWKPTNKEEIYVFLALVVAQSIVKKPTYQMYWAKNPIFDTPFFRKTMPFRRFVQLKQFLHFVDNESYDAATHPNPKLNKIWPIYIHLQNKFSELYTPEKDVTVDESLMLYKGRLGWKQYLPLKRARFGIKSFMLCESSSGYVYSFVIYTGRGTNFDDEYKGLPMSSQVVMSLVKPLLGKGYCVITDNFYTSPQLSDMLLSHRTDSYGTVKTTRKEMPPELRKQKLPKGSVIAFQRGKLLGLKWMDKKPVTMLSTIHNSEMKSVTIYGQQHIKPQVVLDYNSTVGGVDIVDQRTTDYAVPRKRGKKYYKKIFFPFSGPSNMEFIFVIFKVGREAVTFGVQRGCCQKFD
ncbi:piggyBac transposable element-derived protein 4 [Bacillus rossius redtenbacheri]|uniref:piggyBac transposable element-derived protein 4 n=1 Tax=Bacillus rossius redtenbacheri TaxID=93214 RepID=UPI002FDDF95E